MISPAMQQRMAELGDGVACSALRFSRPSLLTSAQRTNPRALLIAQLGSPVDDNRNLNVQKLYSAAPVRDYDLE